MTDPTVTPKTSYLGWLTDDERDDVVSCLRYKALRILKNDPDEANRLGFLSDRLAKMETQSPPSTVVLDLGDENGYWIACCGHVDRYDFVCALDEMGAGTEVSAKGPHPTHAYMVRFADPVDEEEVWWQLDGWHPEAVSIEPVTVLALRDDEGDWDIPKRAVNPNHKAVSDD